VTFFQVEILGGEGMGRESKKSFLSPLGIRKWYVRKQLINIRTQLKDL
jgi:hypothetical protein